MTGLTRIQKLVDLITHVLEMRARLSVRRARNRGRRTRLHRPQLGPEQRPDVTRRARRTHQLRESGRKSRWEVQRRRVELVPRLIEPRPLQLPAERVDRNAGRTELRPDSVAHIGKHLAQDRKSTRLNSSHGYIS